ncbi:MAG: outer membrane lipid asymmetry maintenance protein MlaD [Gammaproteobacteria bacterium]
MQQRTVEITVGLFILAGLAALLVLALKVSNLGAFTGNVDGYQLLARFDNIGGLKPRSPVTMAGVVVGRVASINFDEASQRALVKLNISKEYKLTSDTSASIFTAGLLGEQYLGLEPGGDEKMLKDGDEIKLTQSALVLEQLIGQFLFSKAAEGNDKSP